MEDDALRRQVQHLVDRRAILDCLIRYARGIDRLDAAALESAFHPDAPDIHGGWIGYAPAFARWAIDLQAKNVMTAHHLTTHRCEIDGDVAHAETYMFAYSRKPDGDPASFGGRYIDRLERRDGVWRIALRTVLLDVSWAAPPFWFERYGYVNRDRNEPSYERPLKLSAAMQAQLDVQPPTPPVATGAVDRFPVRVLDGDLAAQVRYLADREAIRDCVMLYCRGRDRLDRDLLASAFHPDATVGDGPVASHVDRMVADHERTAATMHHVMGHACEIDGDTAHAETYAYATGLDLEQKSVRWAALRYVDRLERRAGAWKIAARDVVGDSAVKLTPHFYQGYQPGRRDRTDRSYQRPLAPTAEESARLAAKGPPPPANAPAPAPQVFAPRCGGDLRSDIRYLADRQQIYDRVQLYARSQDRKDAAALAASFHPDGVTLRGMGPPLKGPTIVAELEQLKARFGVTAHHLSGHIADIDGDAAHAESYIAWQSMSPGDDKVRSGSARYIDRLERRNGEWRVALRKAVLDAALIAPAVAPPGQPGAPDRGDPSYVRPLRPRR